MIIFLVTLILNLRFPFLSPTYIQVKQEQRPQELWTEVNTLFQSELSPFTERLSGLELSVISWQRTPSPGLTVKGGKTLNTLYIQLQLVPEWGRGFLALWDAMKSCCHLLAEHENLPFTQKHETCIQNQDCIFQGKPTTAFASHLAGFENQTTKFGSGCLVFAEMISTCSDRPLLGTGQRVHTFISESFNFDNV